MPDQVPHAALVTGAARRIGRAIALALHQAGYAVAIQANRSAADAEGLRDEGKRLSELRKQRFSAQREQEMKAQFRY